ncbi:MAG: hypothetical protein MJ067_02355 [Oscillospiraceae bacterium]|nr:hypothetical protein [Oscillospiraceae bacterium]
MSDNSKKASAKTAGKRQAIADKANLNLCFHESGIHLKTLIPTIVIILLATAAFVKFGFMDRLYEKTAAYDTLSEKQLSLAAIKKKLSGYDELEAEYGRFSYGLMTESEAGLVDRPYVLGILENTISPVAGIEDFALNNNILAVNIFGLTLDETSALVKKLESDPQIDSVSVYRAKADDEEQKASVSMTIILSKEDSGNED